MSEVSGTAIGFIFSVHCLQRAMTESELVLAMDYLREYGSEFAAIRALRDDGLVPAQAVAWIKRAAAVRAQDELQAARALIASGQARDEVLAEFPRHLHLSL